MAALLTAYCEMMLCVVLLAVVRSLGGYGHTHDS